jgi:hypothetical protein
MLNGRQKIAAQQMVLIPPMRLESLPPTAYEIAPESEAATSQESARLKLMPFFQMT